MTEMIMSMSFELLLTESLCQRWLWVWVLNYFWLRAYDRDDYEYEFWIIADWEPMTEMIITDSLKFFPYIIKLLALYFLKTPNNFE